jgi:Ca2+-binding EF-hand superfamily protein
VLYYIKFNMPIKGFSCRLHETIKSFLSLLISPPSSFLIQLPQLSTDSSLYAHYVFKAFDVNCNGAITFRDHIVTLSTLLRGSVYERLKWTFKLYDLNGDGCISRGELAEVVQAVHELMGKRVGEENDKKTRDQVENFT